MESAHARAHRPAGSARHMAAILTAPERSELLADLTMPVLAVHGDEDPLIDASASEDIVNSVRNGHLEIIPRLGHDLSEPIITEIAGIMVEHMASVEVLR